MHEMAIAQSIMEVVELQVIEHKATQVKGVRLLIGEANGIVSDSLSFCFEMLASTNPILAGAQLWIDSAPHRARCPHCAKEFSLSNFIRQCPTCQEWDAEVISGTEFEVLEMEIETDSDSQTNNEVKNSHA